MRKKGFSGAAGTLAAMFIALMGARTIAAPSPDDVFKDKGLAKYGFFLVTADEADLHTTANAVRALKSKVTSESLARASSVRAIQTAEDAFTRLQTQLTDIAQQMEGVKKNPTEYNKLVDPYNSTLKQSKQRYAAIEELRKKQAKLENSQPVYTEAAINAAQKADVVAAKYAGLANDQALSAALISYNKTAPQASKLGPSGNCLADITYLKKCVTDLQADGIPVQMDGDVPVVAVVVNGKSRQMMWDSGASTIAISAETADELGIHATAQDRTINATFADGRVVQCKQVILPLVRVGPFSAENIECTINPKAKTRGPDLIGDAFQSRFQCRLDQQAGVLHLTPILPGARPAVAPVAGGTSHGDAFSEIGLARVGDLLIALQEPDIHAAVVKLRGLKSKVTSESSARTGMSHAVQAATDALTKLEADLSAMNDQLQKGKKNTIEYDRLGDNYNATLKQYKQQKSSLDDLKKKMGQMQDSQSLYVETAIAAVKWVDAAMETYARLAKDAGFKALLDKINKAGPAPVALGPSTGFAGDVDFLKKTLDEITTDGVPIQRESGVPMVEVNINGKTLPMIWDSGASYVSFSAETAAELGLHATDKDASLEMTVADGRKVKSKLVVVPLIRVGGFTAENVECLIDPPGKDRSPDLLGGSFQKRFLCRLDQQAGVIHLTPNEKSAPAKQPLASVKPPESIATPPATRPAPAAPTVPPADIQPVRTKAIGGKGGKGFDETAPRNGVVVGFKYVLGHHSGHVVMGAIEPVYQTGESSTDGQKHGDEDGQIESVLAKPGYAVAGLIARGGAERLIGFKVVFMRLSAGRLDPTDAYESDQIGGTIEHEVIIGNDGKLVIGIFGRAAAQVNTIGLIQSP